MKTQLGSRKPLRQAKFLFGFNHEGSLLPSNEWGFSNKMLDLVRHMDKVRKA